MDKESDEDSLDLDNNGGFVETLADIYKRLKQKKPLLISVPSPFVNVDDGYTQYLVVFPKYGKMFYVKLKHYQTLLYVALK